MALNPPRSVDDARMLLGAAVRDALAALVDLRRRPAALVDGRIERELRQALAFQPPTPRNPHTATMRAAAAARSACAHLDTRAWTDAYLCLLTAQDHLGTHRPGQPR